MQTLSLTDKKKLGIASMTAKSFTQPSVFVTSVKKDESTEKQTAESKLRSELDKVRKERDALMRRVWANERIDKVTIRICDNREIWKAKMGIRGQPRVVAIMPEKVVIEDVFTLPEQK